MNPPDLTQTATAFGAMLIVPIIVLWVGYWLLGQASRAARAKEGRRAAIQRRLNGTVGRRR